MIRLNPWSPKLEIIGVWKKFHPSLFQIPVDLGSYEFCGKATEPIYDVCSMSSECLWVRLGSVWNQFQLWENWPLPHLTWHGVKLNMKYYNHVDMLTQSLDWTRNIEVKFECKKSPVLTNKLESHRMSQKKHNKFSWKPPSLGPFINFEIERNWII